MPSNRRLKAALLLIAVFVLVSIYVTSAARQTRSSDFYTRTSDALAQRAEEERDGKALESDESAVHRRLKEAEEAAKKAADKKGAEYHGEEIKSAAENVKANADAGREPVGGRPRKVLKGGATEKILMEGDDKETKKQSPETDEEREAKEEMNYILKRSPIIIFSKTYCPHSRKAKDILLRKYKISPPPHVVELDEHPLGPKLQNELSHTTGRRTVPNILINGRSIGGGDELQQLHESGKLEDKVRSMGGKRVQISRQ